MQASGPLPSAILATNDYLAAGAIFEAQKQGMSVPGDISITGYGDAEIAGQMIPPLLTIRTPRARIGELAGQYLLSRLSAKRPSLSVMLDVEFVEGGSTAAPAASTSKKSRKPRR
jgi:DNA-binding LacI/PurR family transcriptional regulator